jgi:hypothetical protein
MAKNSPPSGVTQKIEGDRNITAGGNVTITQENINKLPSLLADLIPKLNDIIDNGNVSGQAAKTNEPYTIEDKISHNNLQAYKHWIEEYGQYGAAIDEAYKELDNQRPGARSKVLRNFKARYDRIKGEILTAHAAAKDPMECIRQNADSIIAKVANEVKSDLLNSTSADLSYEDLEFSSIAMTCHAFINCKILEKPTR